MKHMRTALQTLMLTALTAFALAACTARREFPEPAVGWHSPGFTTVYGRLQQLPGTGDNPPVWTIRFGGAGDPYSGQLALTPGDRMVGYTGGETVQIKGHILDQTTTDAFNGRWYVVDSIQMWSEHR